MGHTHAQPPTLAQLANCGLRLAKLAAATHAIALEDGGPLAIGASTCLQRYEGENGAAVRDGLPAVPTDIVIGTPTTGNCAAVCTKHGGEASVLSYETVPPAPRRPLLGNTFDFETGDQTAGEWFNGPRPMNSGDEGDDRPADVPFDPVAVDRRPGSPTTPANGGSRRVRRVPMVPAGRCAPNGITWTCPRGPARHGYRAIAPAGRSTA